MENLDELRLYIRQLVLLEYRNLVFEVESNSENLLSNSSMDKREGLETLVHNCLKRMQHSKKKEVIKEIQTLSYSIQPEIGVDRNRFISELGEKYITNIKTMCEKYLDDLGNAEELMWNNYTA